MLVDFLKTNRDPAELKTALEVLREYKACESQEEWLIVPFDCWRALEHLEGCLERLTDQKQEVGP